MAHERSGIAAIDGAERQRVEARRPGYAWAAAVAAVVSALLLVSLAAAGAVDFLRRDQRQDQPALTVPAESAPTSSDSLETFTEGGLVVDGESGATGTDGRRVDATTRPERQLGAAAGALAALLIAAVALVVLLFAAAGMAVLLFAAALWAAMRGRRPVTRR